MRKRILAFSSLLAAFAVLLTGVLISVAAYRDYRTNVSNQIVLEAGYLSAGAQAYGAEYLSNVKTQPSQRITLVAADGRVLFDSFSEAATLPNHADRPEIAQAFASGEGQATRFSDTLREQTYYYALRLDNGSVLRLASTIKSVLVSLADVVGLVAVICVLVLAVAFFIAARVTKRLVRPINEMDLDTPNSAPVYDELAPLLSRINHQNQQLEKQMETLDRQRAEFSSITDNMSEGFLVLDKDARILSHNKSALRLLQYGEKKAVGKNVLELNRNEPFRQAVYAALQGTSTRCTLELEGRICQLLANPVWTDDTLKGAVLVLVDTTEKQMREQLRREFTANVSHELKTPLTAISGYTELIMNGVASQEDVPAFAASAYAETQRLIALVQDLMLLSKLDEEAAPPAMQPVNLQALCASAANRLQAKANKLSVSLLVQGEAAMVQGVETVLDEIVYNLIDNAIKYNQPDGSVTVSVQQTANGVVLQVQDTGTGIAKADQSRVFERFFRADKSRNKEIPGTGLGLAIVKHGASLHNATLTLESEQGVGTTIRVLFPAVAS